MTFLSMGILQYLAAVTLFRGAAESLTSAAVAGNKTLGEEVPEMGRNPLAGRSTSSLCDRTSPLRHSPPETTSCGHTLVVADIGRGSVLSRAVVQTFRVPGGFLNVTCVALRGADRNK